MFIFTNGDSFGFKDEKINEIAETDTRISDEVYKRFFDEQSRGKQFKLKNIYGSSFEEIFEEIVLPPVEPKPTTEERLSLLEQAMDDLLLGGAL